ncbi:MAG: hypothetical protein J0626_00370, partial [Rhodospirillaceae bacterium]|nr:hypothetical protein [Rhodospirillaceae bacterium]
MIERRASSRLAIAWLAIVLLAAGYLGVSAMRGIPLRTDLLSLLPADSATADLHQMSGKLTEAVARQFVLLAGHVDRNAARAAARGLKQTALFGALAASKMQMPACPK